MVIKVLFVLTLIMRQACADDGTTFHNRLKKCTNICTIIFEITMRHAFKQTTNMPINGLVICEICEPGFEYFAW